MTLSHADPLPAGLGMLPRGLVDGRCLDALRVVEPDPDFSPGDSKLMIAGGIGFGALAVVEIAFLGVTCPVCVVAAPILLGAGIAQRLKWRRKKR